MRENARRFSFSWKTFEKLFPIVIHEIYSYQMFVSNFYVVQIIGNLVTTRHHAENGPPVKIT